MELSEAKETLKNIKRCCLDDEQYQEYGFTEQYIDISDVEAIDTILKVLDNSIPKEKIREKIKELGKDIPMMTPRYFDWNSSEVIKLLKELLGE